MTGAPAAIDEERYEVTRAVRVEAPLAVVWQALTHPAQIGQWFGQRATFPDGMHAGATGTFHWEQYGTFPVQVTELEPMTSFAFRWGRSTEPDLRGDNSTTARFELSESQGATLVSVVETGFADLSGPDEPRAAMTENAQGWTDELDEFTAYVGELVTGRTAAADIDGGTIVRSVRIAAPQAVAWSTLTDPAQIEAWWGHPAVFPDGMHEGSCGTFEWVGHGLMPMRVEKLQPEELFSLLWGDLHQAEVGPDSSLVEFTVAPLGPDASVVTVVETGFSALTGAARRSQMEDNVTGWNAVLGGLAAHTEKLVAA